MHDVKKNLILWLLLIIGYSSWAQEYVLKHHFTDENELLGNYVNYLTCDQNGILWFNCSGTLMSYDGIAFKRHTYEFASDSSDDSKVLCVYRDVHGDIFFFDTKNHYKILDRHKIFILKNRYQKAHYSINLAQEDMMNHLRIFKKDLPTFHYANLLKHHRSGYLLSGPSIRFLNYPTKKMVSYIVPNNKLLPFNYFQVNDNLYVFYEKNNLVFSKGKVIKKNIPICSDTTVIKYHTISAFYFSEGNHFLWIRNSGFYKITDVGDTIRIKKIIDTNILPDDEITSMQMMDESNTIVIASRSKGLFQYSKPTFVSYRHPFTNSSSFNSILKTQHDIYTNNNVKWNIKTKKFALAKSYFSNYGSDYLEDHLLQKKYLIQGSKILTINSTGLPFIKSTDDNLFHCTGYTYNNKLYGLNHNGFFVLENNKITILNPKTNTTGSVIHAMLINNDTVWYGTNKGLYSFRIGETELIFKDLFSGVGIRDIKLDSKKRGILFFTYGNGIYLFKQGKFIKAPKSKTRNFDFTHYMFIDSLKRVWLATDKGIYCTDYERWFQSFLNPGIIPYYFQFSRFDGLSSNELNGGTSHSYIFDSLSGTTYLSSINGLTMFKPNATRINFPHQPITIQETYVDDSLVYDLDNFKRPFDHIKFKIAAAYYGNPENLVLEYRILNQSVVWRSLNNLNEFYLTRKKPGKQVVEIRYRNGFGAQEYHVTSFTFNITPLWYEKTTNRALIIIGILTSFWLILRTRVQIQKKKQVQLKKIIDEQTKNLRKTLEELTLSEDSLRTADTIKEKLIRVLAHDIRSPMISTIYLSNHIRKQLQLAPKAGAENPIHLLDNVIESQNNILNYANDFLAWYNVSFSLVKPNMFDANLHDIIEQVLKMYRPIIETSNNHLVYTANKSIVVRTDSSFLSIIIRNLIDNANKNTRKGIIEIKFIENIDSFEMLICNDARSCTPESLENMKNKLNLETDDDIQHLKLGLVLIKSLSKHLDLPLTCNIYNGTVTISVRFTKFRHAPAN